MAAVNQLILRRALLGVTACLTACGRGQLNAAELPHSELPPAAGRTVDFVADVQPIFAKACYSCHGPEDQSSDYRLDLRSSALKGGDIGGAIVPGDSAASPLIRYVAGLEDGMLMPAEGDPLSPDQIGILRSWIDQGASWPDAADAKVKDKADHWAFKPLANTAIPTGQHSGWGRTPIDAFILKSLEANNMRPSEPADRRTLIRRVTFDLTGLPPTLEELDAFIADESPQAYEKVVDRLLASPRYGERWARHWMDVVHFAETHGHDQDRPRPNAWPYRDYLISSLNDDKPYARFVEEQLAGDVLYPDDPQAIVATGFIAAGPWDESSQLNIVDDTVDKKIARNLDRDDMVTTAMQTFTSMTVGCARCHNHKFDPISQRDYYRLQAVFAGVDRANRPYDADRQKHETRLALLKQKKALNENDPAAVATLSGPGAWKEIAEWEERYRSEATAWVALIPESFASSGGATAERQADGSILYGGTRPDVDTYTIVAQTDQRNITAIRLEVLPDDRLPKKGPGRQDNGNLHLSELVVHVWPTSDPAARRQIALKNPSADFDQTGWTLAMAIDGKPETAWGIYPEVSKRHVGVFELAEPLAGDQPFTLSFTLEQKHGAGHLIGRPRLSVTGSPQPVRASALPDAIAAIVATPVAQRNPEQTLELARHVRHAAIEEQLAALGPPQMVYAAANDFQPEGNFTPAKTPRPIHILRRGDINNPAEEVGPGALTCVPGLESELEFADQNSEGSRRAALARWITDPRNVLTWRSIVNRVWHYHFGRGIVATPSDFGHMGAAPSHPELLDWLAADFIANGGQLKRLHKQIVTSAVYMQSSKQNTEYDSRDADNRLLWRMNRTRLDAESVRDAVLATSGKLDLTMGGPSVKQFIETPGLHVTPNVDYLNFDVDSAGSYRRSVYRFLFRTLPDPFMDCLDCADASQLTATRNTSVTALQALAMLNNRFMVRQSEHFAARLATISSDRTTQIQAAYKLAFGRMPTDKETAALGQYAEKHTLANACRLLLNSNEFMFVH